MSKNDPAERTVRDIRRKTRKQYTAEEKIRIVVSGLRGEESIAALCRREGIDNKCANNRSENSHQPVRRRERKQQRFKSPGSAQRFLNIYSSVYNAFYVQRHLLNRSTFKRFRTDVFNVWDCASAAA